MRPRSLAFVRLLLRAYPRDVRMRDRDTLEAVYLECVERERRRLGRPGVAYAWLLLVADAIAAAVLLHLDERRRRRVASRRSPHSLPKEMLMTRLWQDV